MTVAVNSLVSEVSTLLLDTTHVRWSVADVIAALSEAQVELTKIQPDAYIKTVTVQLVPGAKQTAPSDCQTIVDMRQNENGAAVTPCNRDALDRFTPKWMVTPTASYVVNWMTDPQPDTFYVSPAQGATPARVVITYSALPSGLSEGGNLVVRDMYAPRVVNYALFRLYSREDEAGSAEKAEAYYKLFTG